MITFTVHDPIGTAVDAIHETGGVTLDVTTCEQPTSGYAVSVPGAEESHDWATIGDLADTVTRYVNAHAAELSRPGAHLGAWLETETNTLFLDVSVIVDTRDDAEELGWRNAQWAIYDLAAQETTYLAPNVYVFERMRAEREHAA